MRSLSLEQLSAELDLAALNSAAVFGALPESAIRWMLERGALRAFDQGEYLFEPGQRGDSFIVILRGQISYFKFHNGQFAYIREYKRGEQIGFMSMIALHDRVGKAEAHEDTVVLEVDSAVFHAFHDEEPSNFGILMMNLAREMARALRDVDDILVEKTLALQGQETD